MGPDGRPALDVLIVGAGQSGLAIAFALMRAQVDNILVIDKAEHGREGPWLSYARMRTLRSPKDYTGPDLDVPSLTYRVARGPLRRRQLECARADPERAVGRVPALDARGDRHPGPQWSGGNGHRVGGRWSHRRHCPG